VAARLIFVFTHTGMTAALVAKYKPPVPVMALVVPTLKSDGLTWQLEGRGYARQTLLTRGTMPHLCAPNASGEQVGVIHAADVSQLRLQQE
jgi:pyruvate kinase